MDSCFLCGDLSDRRGAIELGSEFCVASDISPLTVNHCLLFSKRHVRSFGNLPRSSVVISKTHLENLSNFPPFRDNEVLYFEHGPEKDGELGAGCCDHAHIHILPFNAKFVPRLHSILKEYEARGQISFVNQMPFDQISDVGNTNYIWIGIDLSNIALFELHSGQRQILRKIVAEVLGKPDFRSWENYHPESAVRTTELLLKVNDVSNTTTNVRRS